MAYQSRAADECCMLRESGVEIKWLPELYPAMEPTLTGVRIELKFVMINDAKGPTKLVKFRDCATSDTMGSSESG